MDEIKLTISNPNNVVYKCIVLRKFFYMIFIDANGRKLYMYIATVFGGTTKDVDPEAAYCNIVNDPGIACSLNFELSSNSGIIARTSVTDITKSFFEQSEYIEKIWGKCEVLKDQAAVNSILQSCYPQLYPKDTVATFDVTKNKVFFITEGDKQSHKCIVTKGQYNLLKRTNDSLKYQLQCPKPDAGRRIDGLEAMNWIKIEADLSSNILNKPIQFLIDFGNGKLYTPDFTWYFAPPSGHVISTDSYVKIGNKEEKNAFQGVSDETTVYFSEWTNPPESIQERKKTRILFKSAGVEDVAKLSEKETIAVSLHLDNPKGPTNRQFVYGLIVAFLLAFCSDKTRINDYYKCLELSCNCPTGKCICQSMCNAITIVVPLLLLMCFISLILSPKEAIPMGQGKRIKVFSCIRAIGLITMLALIIYIYGFWLIFPNYAGSIIGCTLNRKILLVTAASVVVFNAIYLVYCLFYLGRKISNFL